LLEINKIYNMDCLEGMKIMPDSFIDLCITDPPYLLNKTTGGLSETELSKKWQGNLRSSDKTVNIINNIKFSDWLPEVYRVLKPQSHFYTFVNDKNVQDMLNEATKVGFKLHNILVWKKNNKTPNKYYMKDCEFIIFFRKGKSTPIHNLGDSQYFEYEEEFIWEDTVFKINNINGKSKLHPTQKPTELINKLILNSSKEKDIVFDPFIGSGTTAIACINTNRNYIGFELDKEYYEIAKNRINKHILDNNLQDKYSLIT